MGGLALRPYQIFAVFEEMALFWAARNATKNGTFLGRPGSRFAALKIITKGASTSRRTLEKLAKK
jgi:hypothetical protein